MKLCRRCGAKKPEGEFYKSPKGRTDPACRPCMRRARADYRLARRRRNEISDDYIAYMVLQVVKHLTQNAQGGRAVVPEPTSTGYLDPEVRPYVMKRSA